MSSPISLSRRKALLLAAASSFALVTSGAQATDAQPLKELRIAAVSGSVMPQDFRAGIQKGIFRKHGLDLKISELATGTNNITAAVNGSADLAYADIFAGLSSIKNGFQIGLVTPHNGASPYQFILVRGDSDIKDLKDLEGRTIALGAPPQFRALTSAVLAEQGVDPRKVRFTIVPDQTTFGALLQGKQVDAISTSSAVNAYRWIDEYKARPLGDSTRKLELVDGSPIAGWWATLDWYAKNPGTALAFRNAVRETIAWYRTLSPQERAEVVKEQTKVDLVALDKKTPGVLDAATSYFGFDAPVDVAKLQNWIRAGNEYAGVPTGVDLNRHLIDTAVK